MSVTIHVILPITICSLVLNFACAAPVYESAVEIVNHPQFDVSKIPIAPENANGRETVKLETESIDSKILSVYENKQKQVADFLHPKPLIDTISEHEKYGNEGEHFAGIGRAVVNGFEALANFMNKLLDGPSGVKKTVSSNLTKQLNHLGAKLVGLA